MKRILVLAALGGAAVSAWPLAHDVWQISLPNIQDNWVIPAKVHELGTNPAIFPPDELIASKDVLWTGHIPCPKDLSGSNPNVQVSITNLTPYDYPEVWYVADGETVISNFDELVACGGGFPWLAFKIDSVGPDNTPLVYESKVADNIFQAGETWEFVLQNYSNGWGGPASAFASPCIAFQSTGDRVSTGSILVPEPAWSFLAMAIAALGAVEARRRLR